MQARLVCTVSIFTGIRRPHFLKWRFGAFKVIKVPLVDGKRVEDEVAQQLMMSGQQSKVKVCMLMSVDACLVIG